MPAPQQREVDVFKPLRNQYERLLTSILNSKCLDDSRNDLHERILRNEAEIRNDRRIGI